MGMLSSIFLASSLLGAATDAFTASTVSTPSRQPAAWVLHAETTRRQTFGSLVGAALLPVIPQETAAAGGGDEPIAVSL